MATSTGEDFFDDLKEWSERKLRILRHYLEAATKILGTIDTVYYIDGFAGRGEYKRADGQPIPGSPLAAARLAQTLQDEGKSYKLRCINVEKDKEHFDHLQKVTAPYSNIVRNFRGEFSDHIDAIVHIVAAKPVIAFLDPFGVTGLDLNAIRKLVARPAKTDLWIRFPPDMVLRLDGNYDSPAPDAQGKYNSLLKAYGMTDRNKLHSLLSGNDPEIRRQTARQLYKDQLKSLYTSSYKQKGLTASYRIRSLDEREKYDLIFASRHAKGLILVSNLLYGEEATYQRDVEQHRVEATGQMSMFDELRQATSNVEFDAVVRQVEEDVWRLCKGEELPRLEIHARLLEHSWLSRIKGTHLTKALRNMIGNRIEATSSNALSDDNTLIKFSQ